jgi:hypothetical protein
MFAHGVDLDRDLWAYLAPKAILYDNVVNGFNGASDMLGVPRPILGQGLHLVEYGLHVISVQRVAVLHVFMKIVALRSNCVMTLAADDQLELMVDVVYWITGCRGRLFANVFEKGQYPIPNGIL